MSRFSGPHFYKEDSDVVSIWLPKLPTSEIPENYFEENYSDNDEDPFNQFSSDFLTQEWAQRLIKSYGTEAQKILQDSSSEKDLGINFGVTLTEREIEWLIENEFAHTTEDIIWRRSKLGLHMSIEEIVMLDDWMRNRELNNVI